ncbi:MAG: hypothetical protein HN919_19905 [Verrucomicrobia bacterium]|nr:hypothetical protein [Verrucomicrobiota bacterium]MBT7699562.1 hypothetical protein [Verrucomicrobiota bacterium]
MTRFRVAVTAALIGMAAFQIHRVCATYDFLNYDDGRVLVDHPELYNQATLGQSLKAIGVTYFPREEPLLLRDLSWAVDSRIFGFGNPHGFHAVNVLWHAAVMALFFLFVLQLTRRYGVALLAAGLALPLAIHVEPVAWIMGRKDLMVTAFGLLMLIAVARMLDSPTRRRQLVYYVASLLLLGLALVSKISAIVLPLVAMLLALLHNHLRGKQAPAAPLRATDAVRAVLLFLPHLALSFAVYRWYRHILTAYGLLDRGYTAGPLQHLGTLAVLNPLVLLRYLHNLLAPPAMRLFYTWPSLNTPLTGWHTLLSLLVILTLLIGIVGLYRRRKDLLFYLLAGMVLMVPYLNIVYIGIWMANRYIYFASLFLLVALATLVMEGMTRQPTRVRVGLVLLLAGFIILNGTRQFAYRPHWRNNAQLWSYEMTRPNPDPEAFIRLASHAYTQGIRATDPTERARHFATVSATRAAACARFTPDQTYRLLFLEALMRIVRQEPAADRRAALEAVAAINPTFDAVLWQLTVFYYTEALKQEDPEARDAMARRALDSYRRYSEQTPHDAAFLQRDASIRREFLTDMPFLKDAIEALP